MMNFVRRMLQPKYPLNVFHHIPKCGGTTTSEVFKKWFTVESDYITSDQLLGKVPVSPRLDIHVLDSSHCIVGHFECQYNYLSSRYPEIWNGSPDRFRIFSFVRDPLQLRISLYYYEIKIGRRSKDDQSLVDYLKHSENYLSKRFPCSPSNYREVIEKYFFIGTQENLQESVNQLADLLSKPRIRITELNRSLRDEQFNDLDLTTINEFKERNKLDYLIYDFAQRKFK